jgi:uncharacterized integral membrane protein
MTRYSSGINVEDARRKALFFMLLLLLLLLLLMLLLMLQAFDTTDALVPVQRRAQPSQQVVSAS